MPLPHNVNDEYYNSDNYNNDSDDANGKLHKNHKRGGSAPWRSPHQLLHYTRQFGHILQKTTSVLTCTPFVILAITFVIASQLLPLVTTGVQEKNNDYYYVELKSRMGKLGILYLFVARPLLCALAVGIGRDSKKHNNDVNAKSKSTKTSTAASTDVVNWTERIIAWAFLLSVICTQFPKALSAAAASIAVFAFGLASRQLQFTMVSHNLESTSQLNGRNSSHKNGSHGHTSSAPTPPPSTTTITATTTTPNIQFQNPLQKVWYYSNIKTRATLSTLAVVTSLLFENFLIWVVSATYPPGINGSPDPLQDNGRIVLENYVQNLLNLDRDKNYLAKRSLQKLRRGLNVQWALVAGFGAALVCLELELGQRRQRQLQLQQYQQQRQGKAITASQQEGNATTISQPQQPLPPPPLESFSTRTLGGLALHALITLSTARIIRTISFVLTVLPSQIPFCYKKHFPYPPPSTWSEWLMIGFLPNSRGGCNDLILSGHATVTSTLGCGLTSVSGNRMFSMAVWTLVALDYAIEAYEGLHYSVDMWLGCIVTCLLWQLTKGLEKEGEWELTMKRERWQRQLQTQQYQQQNQERLSNTATLHQNQQQQPLNATIIAQYALPTVLGFFILTLVPEAYVNYFLVGYTFWAGGIFFKWGQTNYSQHILLCLLYVTLGAYL